jgi:hypothetical protein
MKREDQVDEYSDADNGYVGRGPIQGRTTPHTMSALGAAIGILTFDPAAIIPAENSSPMPW